MPDSQDYKSAMDKVTAGQRWKQATLEKMQAETGAQKASRPCLLYTSPSPRDCS